MLESTISELQSQIKLLQQENFRLQKKVDFFEMHPNIAAGIKGETFVSTLVKGMKTQFNASHDIEANRGELIEVKYSSLGFAHRKATANTCRWSWKNVFGAGNKKQYDRSILIGDIDPRYSSHYLSSNCPYIIFDVPFSEVADLTTKAEHGQFIIQLSTNPQTVRSKAGVLFTTYQITEEVLIEKYGF